MLDSHYDVPRWVIGPAPGNENGWAFCESDALHPHEVSGEWISWDGNSWHATATLRFVVPPAEGAEDDESDYGEEAALESMYVRHDGSAAERERHGADAASGAGGRDGGPASGAASGGEASRAARVPPPKPRSALCAVM